MLDISILGLRRCSNLLKKEIEIDKFCISVIKVVCRF